MLRCVVDEALWPLKQHYFFSSLHLCQILFSHVKFQIDLCLQGIHRSKNHRSANIRLGKHDGAWAPSAHKDFKLHKDVADSY